MIDREAERELRAVDGGDEEGEVLAKDEPAVKNVIHATEKQAAQMARKVCAYGCVSNFVYSAIHATEKQAAQMARTACAYGCVCV